MRSVNHSPFKAICFDLFHTLVDVGRVPQSVGGFTADILGVERRQWNQACFGPNHPICEPKPHKEVIRAIAHSIDPSISEDVIHQATEARQRRFDYALRHVREDVLEMLAGLRERGYRLGLISNASSGEVSGWSDSPLAGFFDVTVFSCIIGLAKPDPGIFHHALRQLNCRPQQCVFVGDGGSREHVGATQAGLFPVLLTWMLEVDEVENRRSLEGQGLFGEIDHLNELVDLVVQAR